MTPKKDKIIEEELNYMVKIGLLLKNKGEYIEPKWCNSLSQNQRNKLMIVISKALQSQKEKEIDFLKEYLKGDIHHTGKIEARIKYLTGEKEQ